MKSKITAVVTAVCMTALCFAGCSEEVSDAKPTFSVSETALLTDASQTDAQTTASSESTTTTTTTTTATTTTTTTTTSQTTTTQTTTKASSTTAKTTAKTSAAKQTSGGAKTTAATKASTKATSAKQTTASKVERITGTSPNTAYYKQKLFVMGDSVASGYAAYGRIPYDNSVAKVNVSIRTANYQIALAKAKNPSLVLTSMGMNDWGISTASFASTYKNFLKNLRSALPGSVILVGAITPTALYNRYPNVSPTVVKNHNAALRNLVKTLGDDRIIYFDAYSVVVSDDGVHMQNKYAAADGLHLQPGAYDELLRAMSVVLDKNGAKAKIAARESSK